MNRRVLFWVLLLSSTIGVQGCNIGVKLCKVGQDCEVGKRCIDKRCQTPTSDGNNPPVARITGEGRVKKGGRVRLDGTTSSDADLDYLLFEWSFTKKPEGSSAQLENVKGVQAGFIADVAGTYVVRLTVTDPLGGADDDEFTVIVNHPPVADAGGDKLVLPGATVLLDGSSSHDLDEDTLSYQWKLLSRPAGSKSSLQNPTNAISKFTADKPGSYDVELLVNDGFDEAKQVIKVTIIDPQKVSPVLERLDPWKAPTRSIVRMNLHGKNFIQGAVVYFDDQKMPQASYRSHTHIRLELNLKDVPVGAHKLKIENPGGKTTQALLFQVDQVPIPIVTSISPNKGTAGQEVTVTVKGSGFILGARGYFRDRAVTTKYIDESELKLTLNLAGVPAGKYTIIVENEKDRRSAPTAFEVTSLPPKPRITSHRLSPSTPEVGKVYNYLRLYGYGIQKTTQVFMDNKRYTGKVTHNDSGGSITYLEMPGFSSKGFGQGYVKFQLKTIVPGHTLESNSVSIHFRDPNDPKINRLRYYKDKSAFSTGQTGKIYDYLSIQGGNFRSDYKVFLDGEEYKGRKEQISSGEIRLTPFSTQNMKQGEHELFIRQTVNGKDYRTNTLHFTLQNGQIPQIQSIRPSDNSSSIFTDRKYTYLLIRGVNFYPGLEIILDGGPHKGNVHIDNETQIYMYQFDTTGMQAGNHTLILRNTINGQKYDSKLFVFNIVDGKTPRITRIRFSPTTQLYEGETYQATLTTTNVQSNAVVLVDGKEYTGTANVTATIVILPTFDTTGMTVGAHTIQVRNVLNGKNYDSNPYSVYVQKRPPPRLYNVNPRILSGNKDTKVLVSGNYFSSKSVVQLNDNPVKTTFVQVNQLQFEANAQTLGAGRFRVSVVNPDGQKSPQNLYIDVIPDVGPAVWRVSPFEMHIGGLKTITSFNLTVYGFNLLQGSKLLLDKKEVAAVIRVTSSNYAQVTLPPNTQLAAGTHSIQIKNPDGRTSNATELIVYGTDTPEIYQVSPYYISSRTRATSLRIRGRGFASTSAIYFNGKQIPTSLSPQVFNGVYSQELIATLDTSVLAQAPDSSTLQIKTSGGKDSKQHFITFYQSTAPAISSVSPSYVVAGDTLTKSLRIYGKGFTATTQLLLAGKVVPALFSSTTRLSGTFTAPAGLAPGSYSHWQVQDGNAKSNSFPLYVARGPQFSSLDPPFLKISGGPQQLTLRLSAAVGGVQVKFLGKTHSVGSITSIPLVIDGELKGQKAGLYPITIEDSKGVITTAGIYLIP